MSLLARYERIAKTMPIAQLFYAIYDIKEAMKANKEKPLNDPYVQKLFAEFDAYTVEIQKRREC